MRKILFVFPLLSLLAGCVKNNEDPAWITINPWVLEANASLNGNEGALTENFTDAWVFANGQLIGVFELPVTVPVLASGNTDFQIYPTIQNNGISATKKIYPFVEEYQVDVNLVMNQTATINPITRYKSGLTFNINDFEDPNIGFVTDNTSTLDMKFGSDPQYVQWGSSYGQIHLTTDSNFYAGSSFPLMTLPKGRDVYLEVDYLNNNDLVTGVLEYAFQGVTYHPNIQMNDQEMGEEVWKKIYIDLREIVSGTPNGIEYAITLKASIEDGGLPRDILIDNVKVVHF